MDTMEKLAEKLPPGIGFDWTGLSYEERAGGSQVGILYAISLTVVFLSSRTLRELVHSCGRHSGRSTWSLGRCLGYFSAGPIE